MAELRPKRFKRNVEDFICQNCGSAVKGNGYTDHCPHCLYSRHVDINPGDRASDCRAMMKPIRTEYQRNGSFMVHYRCIGCGINHRVAAASDDNKVLLESLKA